MSHFETDEDFINSLISANATVYLILRSVEHNGLEVTLEYLRAVVSIKANKGSYCEKNWEGAFKVLLRMLKHKKSIIEDMEINDEEFE